MKKCYSFFLFFLPMALAAQSLTVSGTAFYSGEPISFTYDSPDYTDTDWIGIFPPDVAPGTSASTTWQYIPSPSGAVVFEEELEPGTYIAYLLCCDGYDILAFSEEFVVSAAPTLTTPQSIYIEGEALEFSYFSPAFSSTDWIGIYPAGEIPDGDPPSLMYQYITDTSGVAVFTDALPPGDYVAYLLCCDGYQVYAQVAFQIQDDDVPQGILLASQAQYGQGEPIQLEYASPAFAENDWIGIYHVGDNPNTVLSIVWQYIPQESGTATFAGTLEPGLYKAYLFCCDSYTVYAQSAIFEITEGVPGAALSSNASVYPVGSNMIFSYTSPEYASTDWIGIYERGQAPGEANSIIWQYIPGASGYITFEGTLPPGDYTAYLLCCDGYSVYAFVNFTVGDETVASLVASKLFYMPGEEIVFTYNSPEYTDTDWIGIYAPGDVPGDVGSTDWQYIPAASGQAAFAGTLGEGRWIAHLLCCDGYDIYASAEFDVTMTSGQREAIAQLALYPNPATAWVQFELPQEEGAMLLEVRNAMGQLVRQERVEPGRNAADLGRQAPGLYTILLHGREKSYIGKVILQ